MLLTELELSNFQNLVVPKAMERENEKSRKSEIYKESNPNYIYSYDFNISQSPQGVKAYFTT